MSEDTDGFFQVLSAAGFKGDMAADRASRLTHATDNSIYQVEPQAILFPQDGADLALIMSVANQSRFSGLSFVPRGGGTSCNGQPLGNGVVIDTSRHMRRVLDFDPKARTITIEPGLVRDQLNAYLKPHGLFFPPHVSTSSRATIGGMVSNDSSGKGSLIYGKTSAHVIALDLVLADGSEASVSTEQDAGFGAAIKDIIHPHSAEIKRVFPDLIRSFTGYDLSHACDEAGNVSVPALICGSEGTLALIRSITCRLTRLPTHTAVVPVRYSSLDSAFRHVPDLLRAEPSAIEFIDDKILGMAQSCVFWDRAGAVLGGRDDKKPARALNFVELVAETEDVLLAKIARLETALGKAKAVSGWSVARRTDQIAAIWDMRKACQGLLLARQGRRRAQPFVEDFVVPPERLADVIAEVRKLLRHHDVDVGMFGHADVGVVHLRPLLDMTDPQDRARIRGISDAVHDLTLSNGGMIWGEHGKGYRSEYASDLLGPCLSGVMSEIKTLFDPANRLNPGKIAVPRGADASVALLDAVSMRGEIDQGISPTLKAAFSKALHCNGNGNCFTLDQSLPICPSYKATGDRRLSPKGRAGLLREWVRLRSRQDDVGLAELSPQIKAAMDSCLSCKSCSGSSCPIRIDIPDMKSGFLDWYHQTNRRPLTDHFVRHLETLLPVLAPISALVNWSLRQPLFRGAFERLGLVDVPMIENAKFVKGLHALDIPEWTAEHIQSMTPSKRRGLIAVVPDSFSRFFDPQAALAQLAVMKHLADNLCVLTYRPTGKPLHVKGFSKDFQRVAEENIERLSKLAALDVALVGMDPAATLMFRDEYRAINDAFSPFFVALFSEWLEEQDLPQCKESLSAKLLQHCTEKSLEPGTSGHWRDIFQRAGVSLEIVEVGCCGMAGLFGHERQNQEMSRSLFDRTWRRPLEHSKGGLVAATGYSCRTQCSRFSKTPAVHPAAILLRAWDLPIPLKL